MSNHKQRTYAKSSTQDEHLGSLHDKSDTPSSKHCIALTKFNLESRNRPVNSGAVMNNDKETCDLARLLLIATGTHVTHHISNQKNKLAYARASSRCQHICSEHVSDNDLPLMKQKLITLRYDVDKC